MFPSINGTEERLDALADELRGLRQDVGKLLHVLTPAKLSEPIEGVVELREPKPPRKPRKKAAK